ncbi:MAG: 2-amino-4-hydroxy-6-hydroxymethyldihydropteridine diphosphokinase [Candidatus Hydrogenedentes bacterium]|nr:2-amino-4-hydroxy-6-hydroxymethyldihydropteridine diphosphokinase [Candidatus Hydrogenedentota bacterium]
MIVQLSLGSNLGDRASALRRALRALAAEPEVELLAWSHCYETEPIGIADQPPFLNLAVEIETALAPLELLNAVKAIEAAIGRRKTGRWGPREIDIDIILWGDTQFQSERLTLPHREFRERAFVLVPMAEIAPDAVDPLTGETVTALAGRPGVHGWIEKREKISP